MVPQHCLRWLVVVVGSHAKKTAEADACMCVVGLGGSKYAAANREARLTQRAHGLACARVDTRAQSSVECHDTGARCESARGAVSGMKLAGSRAVESGSRHARLRGGIGNVTARLATMFWLAAGAGRTGWIVWACTGPASEIDKAEFGNYCGLGSYAVNCQIQ